jgi:protein-S-isoprenylcysteine O-methyltransferase Ste14
VLIALLLWVCAGRLDRWAWVYLAVSVAIVVVNSLLMSPELIAERGRVKANVPRWDTLLTRLVMLPYLGVYIIAGLDTRWSWSPPQPLGVHVVGLLLLVGGQALFTWAMLANAYFSTAVRLQPERGQTVASGGPYRWVRHPGYVGFILATLGVPLVLGSLWALLAALLIGLLFIVRTALEDRTLQAGLPGYADYAQRVHYRLLPGIW